MVNVLNDKYVAKIRGRGYQDESKLIRQVIQDTKNAIKGKMLKSSISVVNEVFNELIDKVELE